MTQELSANPFYAIIVFHDKSKKFINEVQYNAIISPFTNPNVARLEIDGSIYSKASVSKILTLTEFYEEYPDQKPAPVLPSTPSVDYQDFRSDKLSKTGLLAMIRGLHRAIVEITEKGEKPNKSLALLQKAESAFFQRYGEYPKI